MFNGGRIMETIIRKLDEENIDLKVINEASTVLRNGGIVAVPTETVYGLGANAFNESAVKKIFVAKG